MKIEPNSTGRNQLLTFLEDVFVQEFNRIGGERKGGHVKRGSASVRVSVRARARESREQRERERERAERERAEREREQHCRGGTWNATFYLKAIPCTASLFTMSRFA